MKTQSKEARLDALVEKMHGLVNPKNKAKPRFAELVQRRSIKYAIDVMRAFRRRTGVVPMDISPTYRGGVQLDYPMEQLRPGIECYKQLGLEIEILGNRTVSLCLPDWTEHDGIKMPDFLKNMRQYIGKYGQRR